jgi:hypothetical protein
MSNDELAFAEAKLRLCEFAHTHALIDTPTLLKQRARCAFAAAPTSLSIAELALWLALPPLRSLFRAAWLPLCAAALRLAVSELHCGRGAALDALWTALETPAAHVGVPHVDSLAALLLVHAAELLPSAAAPFVDLCAQFVSCCANRCDRKPVLAALQPHVRETVLGALAVPLCDTLQAQLADYGVAAKALPAKATESVVLRLISCLQSLVKAQPLRISDALVSLVTMLVDLTAQAPTGRYVSWYLVHRSCKSTTCEPLGWLQWLTLALAPLNSRLLTTLVTRLECNVFVFLARPRDSASATYAAFASGFALQQKRYGALGALLGVDSALPDAQYVADLVAQRLHVPKLSVHFLNFDDYATRHLALYKAHVCWQLWRDVSERRDDAAAPAFQIEHAAQQSDDNRLVTVAVRCARRSLAADGSAGKPSSFVVLTGSDVGDSSAVLVAEYVSHQSERAGDGDFVHRLRLRSDAPFYDVASAKQLILTNPALAGSLAVLQNLLDGCRRISGTPWLSRVLLGTARPADIAALSSAAGDRDAVADASFVLGMGVFPTAAAVADCVRESQTLPADRVQLTLDGADPEHRGTLQIEGAPRIAVEFRAPRGSSFAPYAAQQEAILSSLTRRITCVIGPPGTGKSDTAVRMIVALLGRFRGARLLVTAVSNLALDQLIDKLIAFVPTGTLLRLGGQTQLATARRFTVDRIVAARARRFVSLLHELYGVARDSVLLDLLHALPEAARTPELVESGAELAGDDSGDDDNGGDDDAKELELPAQLWRSSAWRRFVQARHGALSRSLAQHEAALSEVCAIGELLALPHVQRELLLLRGSTLVFATTTGMAMRHRRLCEGGVTFPMVLMEEAAKVLETEALTCFAHGVERIVLIGDHLQLPPLVGDDSLRDGGVNYSQSLFARLLRAGVAAITLNRQGRAVSGIADLYRFRYSDLRDLGGEQAARGGGWPLRHAANFVDVRGAVQHESNVREAKELVAFFAQLCAKGVDPARVSVLATYRNQCALLQRELVQQAARPRDTATTDAFQGLQNDIVLVSLVSVHALSAHMRDVARIVVLLSRARTGLVLFGRFDVFWADAEWRRSLSAMGGADTGPRPVEWLADTPESTLFRGTARSSLDDEAEALLAQLANLQL